MTLWSVQIIANSRDALRALDEFHLDLKHRAARQLGQEQFMVPGILTETQIRQVEAEGYIVQRISDLTQVAAERLRELSRVNRFLDARAITKFENRAVLGYMSVDEVESALITLERLHPTLITLIELPHRTWENRISRAVRVRAGTNTDRLGALFTGSMHAREWGGSDICISFLVRLLDAYRNNAALTYGGKSFAPAQLRTILENLDIFVFPDVNPDGKNFSQIHDIWWRKNRNPTSGVDVNRNFDFLWNSGIGTSSSATSNIFKGTSASSEPETQNVLHMLDTYKNIGFYVDLHSYGELILYSWGDDDNQSLNPAQNFLNPAYDGMRGVVGDMRYGEFMPTQNESMIRGLAGRMNEALAAVRGHRYTVQQAVGLYSTSATSDDYAFSRHIVNGATKPIYAYTIEFGTEFIPPHSEMLNIIDEVSACLTELCVAVAGHATKRNISSWLPLLLRND